MTSEPRSAAASSTATALDAAAVARLRELDPSGQHGVVARVMATFEASLRRLLRQLEAERGQDNAAVVAGIAHTLKSSSASVGALGLAAMCTEIEARLRGGDVSALQSDIDRMMVEGQAALCAVAAMSKP